MLVLGIAVVASLVPTRLLVTALATARRLLIAAGDCAPLGLLVRAPLVLLLLMLLLFSL